VQQQSKSNPEITDYEWEIMWENFRRDANLILGELRRMVSLRFDEMFGIKEWDAFCPIIQYQPRLEKTIRDSGPETGWVRNPVPLFQELIKAVAGTTDPEIREILGKLELLKQKAEDIWTVD
jgi:hypothetical protein